MSRCFPYPPPGFEKKHDPLIESSIKLQKEKVREKERKKEKKEKKNKIKEKSKDGIVQKEDKKHGHKKRHREERKKLDLKCEYQLKAKEETEQLERSSLTEEGLPLSQYLCDSPDSSQNSSKRIKLDATEAPVSVLRIRLPSLKQIESRNPSLPKQSSLSVLEQKNIELPALSEIPCKPLLEQRQIAQIDPVVRSCLPVLKQRDASPSVPDKEPCFSGRTETTHVHKETNDGCNDLSLFEGFQGSRKSRKKEVKFKDLIVNWHPQPLQIDQDQDWLFGCARQQKDIPTKDPAVKNSVPVQGNVLSSWPPRACHHPEANAYMLPFVLPF